MFTEVLLAMIVSSTTSPVTQVDPNLSHDKKVEGMVEWVTKAHEVQRSTLVRNYPLVLGVLYCMAFTWFYLVFFVVFFQESLAKNTWNSYGLYHFTYR